MWTKGNIFKPTVAGYYWRRTAEENWGQVAPYMLNSAKTPMIVQVDYNMRGEIGEYAPFAERLTPFTEYCEYWSEPILCPQ